MDEGDEMFTPEAIEASGQRLEAFLKEVDTAKGDHSKLRIAFKSVVEDFNRYNEEYHSFVETSEREELAAFLNSVADAAGFPYQNKDVTWEWRTNW